MKENHKQKVFYLLVQIISITLLNNCSVYAQNTKFNFANRSDDTIRAVDKLRFLDSVNKYRIKKGIAPLVYSFHDDKLAKYRVKTIFKHLDSISDQEYLSNYLAHLHYNFEKNVLAYEERKYVPIDSVITAAAECVARLDKMGLIIRSDIVNNIFQGWKNSHAHWNVMMDSTYTHMVLDWKMDRSQRDYDNQKGCIASLVLFNKVKAKKREQEDK